MTADRQRLKYLLDCFRYDPLGYVQKIIRPPRISNDQIRFLKAVAQDRCRVSVSSGTTTGKTSTLAWLVLWFINTHSEARVPCTATKYDQITKTLWPEIAKWHAKMRPEFAGMIRFQQEKIFLIGHENSSFAWPMAAAKERIEGFQGVHANNVMFLFDEAAGIPREIFDACERSVGTPGARWIVAGNPNRASGPFFDSHHKNASEWTTLVFSSIDSPFCHPDYAASIARKHGDKSNMYRIAVLGRFPTDDPDTLIPHDWAEEARSRAVSPDRSVKRIAGLDPSGGGADPVGFCIRQGTLAYDFQEWPAIEPMPTVGRIKKMWDDRLFDLVVVDAIGVGSGVVSRLLELEIPHVCVNVGMPSIVRQDCHKLRDELWWQAREWFESRIVRIEPGKAAPSDEALVKFVNEVTMPKYGKHSTGKILVEDKDSLRMASRLGHSPNIADAFCLTFAQGIPVRGRDHHAVPGGETVSGTDYVW